MLRYVTFTGIDDNTDIGSLEKLTEQYPYVEFGVLMSKNHINIGDRYMSPDKIRELEGRKLNLCAHLCGEFARKAFAGNWNPVVEHTGGRFGSVFKRCQLNVAPYHTLAPAKISVPEGLEELIIQQKSLDDKDMVLFNGFVEKNPGINTSLLVDPSGGLGISGDITVVAGLSYSVGYAGGINPSNVVEKLTHIMMKQPLSIDDKGYWIDMESGVRDNDVFSIHKVIDVIAAVEVTLKTCGKGC